MKGERYDWEYIVKILPKWLLYSLLSLVWWGIFGFLGKVGADRISPAQMQIFFTIGMIPVAIACALRLHFKIATNRRGVSYSVSMGLFAALGCLAFFGAMKTGKASLVAPITCLYPALTVVLSLILLRERLNRVQTLGLVLAMVSIVILSM
jgi:bacterial/archaeal transporter family protein